MNVETPILYVFRGKPPYLELSIRQTRRFNPHATIYHVTDNLKAVAGGAIGLDDTAYHTMANRFAKSYEHMSVHSVGFELFCFQRWMVAYEAMADLGLRRAVLMDGDVLLWSDMADAFELYGEYGISWTEPDQPGTVLVTDREALKALCDHMLWHYENPAGLAKLRKRHEDRKAAGLAASICDMNLLGYFKQANPGYVGDTGQVRDGGRFDHNMNVGDGYEIENGLKRFVWREGTPFGRSEETGELIRFYSMHFVGQAKGYMGLYMNERNLTSLNKVLCSPQWFRARLPSAVRKIKEIWRRRMPVR